MCKRSIVLKGGTIAWIVMAIATDISYLFALAMMIAGFRELSGIFVDHHQT
ncbi:MAG: hypothetical protein ACXQS6_06280 [Candidatus Syntropharchaeales archaeon]